MAAICLWLNLPLVLTPHDGGIALGMGVFQVGAGLVLYTIGSKHVPAAELAQEVCDFAREFARKEGDETFELRLELGLARSFATSYLFDSHARPSAFGREGPIRRADRPRRECPSYL